LPQAVHHLPGNPLRLLGSVRELLEAIGVLVDGCNERCPLFAWRKHAENIVAKSPP
jgi:hypothetical protein